MKKTTNLLRSKGFTLVECVVAIAVFAVLTTMILMIVGNAVKLSKEASDAEKDLNNVVDSVINDNSNKVLGADSKTLEMSFGSGAATNFKMSYTTVDGDKNYLQCPDCKNKFYNLDFMQHIYSLDKYTNAVDSLKTTKKISYWFDPSSDKYKCPLCGKEFQASSVKVKCLSCNHEDTLNNLTYSNEKGSYSCSKCNSGSLVQIGKVTEKDAAGNDVEVEKPLNMSSDVTFMVSGMAANALRYGTVVQPSTKAEVAALTPTPAGATNVSVTIEYVPSTIVGVPGYYTATVNGITGLASGTTTTVSLKLPPYYSPKVLKNKCSGNPDCTVDDKSRDIEPNPSILKISDLKSGDSKTVAFTLTNYKNGNSFEDDYKADAGTSDLSAKALQKLWYGASSNNLSLPRQEDTVTLVGDSTVSADVPDTPTT